MLGGRRILHGDEAGLPVLAAFEDADDAGNVAAIFFDGNLARARRVAQADAGIKAELFRQRPASAEREYLADQDQGFADEPGVPEIEISVKKLVLFDGKATEKIKVLLTKGFPFTASASMDEAFAAAVMAATPHDIVLLSPGATSFGIFKNEYDRGDQFKAAFEKLR